MDWKSFGKREKITIVFVTILMVLLLGAAIWLAARRSCCFEPRVNHIHSVYGGPGFEDCRMDISYAFSRPSCICNVATGGEEYCCTEPENREVCEAVAERFDMLTELGICEPAECSP